ncbi:MAG TPA: adventurous gliding motility TPR repeat lipoprotein GltE [Myxococcaceae bacterium]|nr:adventurous gliding motility TPR repeat lipoprotein GltE [Myxococcaceae bacterium]
MAEMKVWGAVLLTASFLVACGGKKGAVRADAETAGAAGVEIGPEGAGPDQISTRAKLKFDDAVKALAAAEEKGTGDWESLERQFQAALKEDRNLAEADYNLGLIAERRGDRAAAERHYLAALGKKPSLTMAGHNLAAMRHRAGDTAGAAEIYRAVLERAPEDGGAYAGLAELSRLSGDCDTALEQARAALVRDPELLDPTKVMMRCHLTRKDLARARLVAQRALRAAPNDPDILMVIGNIFMEEGKVDLAKVQFKAAVTAKDDYAPAHQVLADLAMREENWPRAEEHLRKLLQVNGNNAAAHLNLGIAYRGLGQADKAMQEYDEAEKLDPGLAPIYLNRAIVLHREKNAPERALELYRKYVGMAGGEFAIGADSPVYSLISEAETLVAQNLEAERMARVQAAEAAQAAQLEAAEAARLEAEGAPADPAPVQAAGGEPTDPFADEPQ